MKSNNDDDFIFTLEDALCVVWDNISKDLKTKYTYDQIKIILELEQIQFDELGINLSEGELEPICEYPINVDWDELKYQIAFCAVIYDIYITMDELDEILDAETIYYQINGRISDLDELLN
jgi:hypothetical protein